MMKLLTPASLKKSPDDIFLSLVFAITNIVTAVKQKVTLKRLILPKY